MAEKAREEPAADLNLDRLRQLIGEDGNREKACQPFLPLAARYLANSAGVVKPEFHHIREQGMTPGYSDYIVVGDELGPRRRSTRKMWLWECKAPQHYLFKVDVRNRLHPSNELVYAENQLLNYHHQLVGDSAFQRRWDIKDPSHILLGGIIIGCNERYVQAKRQYKMSKEELMGLYEVALDIREKYFYHQALRILTWDNILTFLTPHG